MSKRMFRNILVPTDGTEVSGRALDRALELAGETGARITALNVVPVVPLTDYVLGVASHPTTAPREEAQRAAEGCSKQVLDEACARAEAAGVGCDRVTELEAAPWRAIVATAIERECDLIVMGTHARSGLEALLLGSETKKVVSHTTTPVLVLH